MRTIKQLLIILRDTLVNPQGKSYSGMCSAMFQLNSSLIITDDEHLKLISEIFYKRPRRGKFYDEEYKLSAYWWKPYNLEPRIEWLNHKINKYEKHF